MKTIQRMQRDKKFADARSVMKRIGAQLVQERKLALSEGDVENAGGSGKDLLSLLVKANTTDPEGSSLSDDDVQDRKFPPSRLNLSCLRITLPTFCLSSFRNRHLYCRRPRDKQCRDLLVPSLFIHQLPGARAPT